MTRKIKNTKAYKGHPLIRVWQGILTRCYTPCNNKINHSQKKMQIDKDKSQRIRRLLKRKKKIAK
jgi:hypothetical protein